jgi:hypothetical protein
LITQASIVFFMSTLVRVGLLVITVAGILSIPIVGVLLGRFFDRWLGRNSVRLASLAFSLTVLASASLLLAPLRTCCEQGVHYQRRSALQMDGWHAVGLAAIPVLVVLVPLALETVVKSLLDVTVGASIGRIIVVAVDAAAVLFLAGIMYLISAALIGFLYLPATAALGAATVRSWARPGQLPRPGRAPTARPISG